MPSEALMAILGVSLVMAVMLSQIIRLNSQLRIRNWENSWLEDRVELLEKLCKYRGIDPNDHR